MKRLFFALLFFSLGGSACFAQEPPKKTTAQDYYAHALARYQEIEGWKQSKNWEGVYDKGPEYNKQIIEDLKNAEPLAKGDAAMIFKIRFLRWQSIRDDNPDQAFGMFGGVVAAADDAAQTQEGLAAVKSAADGVTGLEDKNLARRLYEVYVKAVMAGGLNESGLKERADQFLGEGNLYLAKTLYEGYLRAPAADDQAQAQKMISVAGQFACPGDKDGLDPVYAENLYEKAFLLAGDKAFDQASMYRRAFNLERLKDYENAVAQYKKLAMSPEIYFRLGVLTAFGLKDPAAGAAYLTKIVTDFPRDPMAASANYQLGVLAQGAKENEKARGYYEAVTGAKDKESELDSMARDRLKEIEEGRELVYGLRLFLDGTFKSGVTGGPPAMPLSVDVTGTPAKGPAAGVERFVVTASNPQTGCMVPNYSYEWSGDMGGATNIPNSADVTTTYPSAGLKVVTCAVVGPSGLEGVGFDIVQVS